MALFWLSFFVLMTLYIFDVIPGSHSSNFPLLDCKTDEIDIMFLHYPPKVNKGKRILVVEQKQSHLSQLDMSSWFLHNILHLPTNDTTPRVQYNYICDMFSVDDPTINITSVYFKTTNNIESKTPLYYDDYLGTDAFERYCDDAKSQPYVSARKILESKITFIHRVFREMSGVRKNVTHVAVIYLDGEDLSYEDSRDIPRIMRIMQKPENDVKIFTVAIGVKNHKETIHLNDTLLISAYDSRNTQHILTMAICNQCINNWTLYEHRYSTDFLSCYNIIASKDDIIWHKANENCKYRNHSSLATIETPEEIITVTKLLHKYIVETQVYKLDNSSNVTVQFYIGLRRDLTSSAKRFQWLLREPSQYRPLVVSNWTLWKPSDGRDNACGLWQFVVRRDHMNNTNNSSDVDIIENGWVDVLCSKQLSKLALCEVVLARRLDGENKLRIAPASNESINKALSKGDIMKLGDNIVSVSTQVGSTHFLNFFKESDSEIFALFDCGEDGGNPRYISYAHVCDYVDHCNNKRDESMCMLDPRDVTSSKEENVYGDICPGELCCDGSCLPFMWLSDGEVDCSVCSNNYDNVVNDEDDKFNFYKRYNIECAFICNVDFCVSFDELNNTKPFCEGPEGPIDETIGKLEIVNTTLGRRLWAPKCVYVKDVFGGIMGYRNLTHLQNCSDFECPEGYFKCPNTYCIPQHYVIDGNIDCPTGEDEQNDNIHMCSGNFACWNSQMCLHPDLVCDGHPECPHKDDEMDCKVDCPKGLRCLSWRVTVSEENSSITLSNLDFINRKTRYLDLSNVDLSSLKFGDKSSRLDNVIYIKLSKCNISTLDELLQFLSHKVQRLDISYNMLKIFNYNVSQYPALSNIRHLNVSYNRGHLHVKHLQLKKLEVLDLSHTSLLYLDNFFFTDLINLKHLNLSYTSITDIYNKGLSDSFSLQTFDLRGLFIENIYPNLFNDLTISQHLYTDNFTICCPLIRGSKIPDHTCHSPIDAISSCFDLVGDNVQRVLLWLVAILAVIGNVTVIVYRLIWDRSVIRNGYGLLVANLGISDFIMGVYLFIIAGADYYYHDNYVLEDRNWRESIVCRLSGFLATLSCETSTYFICLITLDRFLIIKYPFGQIHFSNRSKKIAVLLTWVIGFHLALVPIVLKFEIYSSNAMCLGLPLTTQRLRGWEYSFSVFIVHNFLLFLVIACGQRAIFIAMRDNRIDSTSPHRSVDISVAKQLLLVSLSNFLCWFPVGIMGLIAIGGYDIGSNAYAWTTVVILPLNSAANPVLYTIPALMVKWEKFKKTQ